MTETWGEEAQNSLLSFAPFTFLANGTHHSDQPCPRPRVSFHIFRKLQSIVWRGFQCWSNFWPRNTRYISKKSNLENLIKDGWRCPDPGTTRGAKSRHGQTEAACALLFHQTKTIEDIPLIQYIREGVKKNIFFGTLSQTSDSTHPPRTFGTTLSEK